MIESLSQAELFFTVFGAVLSAGLLTALCVWGAVQYGRHERGEPGYEGKFYYFWAMFGPIAFCALAVYIALGGE